jgi:hypothetical protein
MADQSELRSDASREPLADLYRLGTTYRWQVVHLSKKQTVAEHSYFTTVLFMRFAEICFLNNLSKWKGLEYALLHDADEAWSGDIPGPLKAFMDVDLPLDRMLRDWAPKADKATVPGLVAALVKLADLVEAAKYLHKYGDNDHAIHVYTKYRKRIDEFLDEVVYDQYGQYHLPDSGVPTARVTIKALWDCILEFIDGKETYIDDYM